MSNNFLNFPLLKTFNVDSDIVVFLNRKFKEYEESHLPDNSKTTFSNSDYQSGYQTSNLLEWDDDEYKKFINNKLFDLISENISIEKNKIEYYWNHILDYRNGGKISIHNHMHNEDFVFFIYLSNCNSGNTIFYLNNYDEKSFQRTTFKVKPKKNLAACFSSLILHEGEFTLENKRVFVAGIRIKQ